MTFEEQTFFLQADGHRLRALTIAPPGKSLHGTPVLVFLHEGLGSIEIWRDFPRLLVEATGVPALVYDRYGSGGSEPLREPRREIHFLREAVEVLPDVLAACGIDRPILIGHSDGGSIALLYAAHYPQSPLGVIAEAAHVFAEELTLSSIRKADEAFAAGTLREKLARYHGEQTDSMFHGWADVWLSPECVSWSIEPELPAITCPVLVIQGENDEYGTAAQVRAITQGVSGRTKSVMLPGCAHIAHHQAREAVLAEMTRFIGYLTK